MENIHLLIFPDESNASVLVAGSLYIQSGLPVSASVCLCVTARDVNKGRETVAAVQMTDCMTEFVRECVSMPVHVCVVIPQ